ncbi:UDP-N-acetylmuramoyl-tripeptide--D-alanyl-D-alanine ligase [Pelagicoccus sp. SDUM812003]|uniref:UDP-N-acetylmuramoyl-tripeptide--D-alanyl-D- alanine ligase n=1 Tax=Pelagicoccus sp. SDUM812003 TaxID=3041267 RepID=UPI00280E8063|nr:UDP-N-acetylmuramoyl-tripeptide--D-alanyl-D-alanine ligase [Pelagicoccus sp. SDUM812003]MDQ8204408.1 UDP-N-acetylmuramoyl-tripeptide--D-alanyl-D-alanine ligase [Pelagicoccus sp. SDUM812003]
MDTIDPALLAKWSGGEWRNGDSEGITGLSIDTRTIAEGELFAAIRTEKRDGHEFLGTALENGAAAALVDRFRPEIAIPQLVVQNVSESLLEIAKAYRLTWNIPVVGVTGSCGKTSCKELLGSMLGESTCLRTRGNLNNLLGVPLTIVQPFARQARHAVLEAGISEPGEMKRLAYAIAPDWVIVTAIGPAHLEDLGTESNVAMEKGRLTSGPRVKGVFLGETCERYAGYLGGLKASLVRPSSSLQEDWSYRVSVEGGKSVLQQRIYGEVATFRYAGYGRGLASNVALAIAMAKTLGISDGAIRESLSAWRSSGLRGEWRLQGKRAFYVDCYNANPLSMRDALDTFVENTPNDRPRLFVIGCMEELGEKAPGFHERLGSDFPFRNQDQLLVMGDEATSVLRGMEGAGHDPSRYSVVKSIEEVREKLMEFEGSVFLKGSRRYRLEKALVGMDDASNPSEGKTTC